MSLPSATALLRKSSSELSPPCSRVYVAILSCSRIWRMVLAGKKSLPASAVSNLCESQSCITTGIVRPACIGDSCAALATAIK